MSPAGERAIRSIAVLGGGIVGLSAAIAFARALRKASVTVVDVPPDPAALADRMPGSLPAIGRFHAEIGLDELDLVRRGIATHRLGTRFERWSADGEPWYHVFGDYGLPLGSAPFHQLWARERAAERALPYHRYSAAAALAEAGKFVHPTDDPKSPLSTYLHALQLDPERYRERLAAQCAPLRIERVAGSLGGIERREDGGLAALLLSDGRRIEADLFVDCAGPSAPLLSALDDGFEDWGEWLPCDRLLIGWAATHGGPSPCDRATATPDGWRWEVALADRTMSGFSYASAITAEARARSSAPEAAEAVAIRPGRRPEPWVRNVLAIGDAAAALDPLEATNLHLVHSAILRALDLLPGRDCHRLELAEYNRRTAQETARVRDFLALHYLRAGRTEGPFWTAIAGRTPPDSLAHTLEQFERRGKVPFYEEESFERGSWLAVLLGMGVTPRAVAPVAAGVDPAHGSAAMRRLADSLAALPDRLPAYRDYLVRMRDSTRPQAGS